MDILSWILTLAISSGQLIRLPYFSGGITALDISVALLSLVGLLKLKFKLQKPPFLIPGFIFIFVAVISLIFTSLHLNFSEIINAFSYTARFFLYFLFAWIIFSLQKNLTKSFIFAGLVIASLGFIQIIFLPDLRFLTAAGWDPHYFRLVSTFLDPNFTGAFLILTLLLLTISYLLIPNTPRVFYLFFIIVYIALLTTFSRSSYLMFLVSGTTLSFLKKSKKLFLLTIFLFLTLMLGFKVYAEVVAEPRNIDREESASFRLGTWQQGLEIFQKNPVLGVGFNAYRYAIREYKLGDGEFLARHGSSGNDSSLLFVLSTTGVIGLLAYLYFLFSIVRSNKIIILPAVAGLITHSFFSNSLFFPPIFAWIVLLCVTPKK